jgi:putative hydrolase of the HAD superfamily
MTGDSNLTYDAVIFDLFGTLIDSANPQHLIRLFRDPVADLNCDADAFMSAWLGIYQDRATGKFGSVANEVIYICKQLGIEISEQQLQRVVEDRLQGFREHCTPRATVPATLTRLRQDGVKVGLVSDCGQEIPDIWQDTELAPLIDATVFSCNVGATKPHPSLYKLACEQLSVQPARCLYVGDGGSRELTGAAAVGMHPVLIRVDYEAFFDEHRADAVGWTGRVISDISQVLEL